MPRHSLPNSTDEERFWSRVAKSTGCWLWVGGKVPDGYGLFRRGRNAVRPWEQVRAHRFSWMLAYGDIPSGLFVCHHCDTPACVRPDHLFLGTLQENTQDSVKKGRRARGTINGSAKLSECEVTELRRRYSGGGVSLRELAQEYNVSKSLVSMIVRRTNWRHVP